MQQLFIRLRLWFGLGCLCLGSVSQGVWADAGILHPRVEALLAERCFRCHGEAKQRGGLRLDVREWALRGGDSGTPAVEPGEPERSLLYELITAADVDDRMPPPTAKEAPLTEEERKWVRLWIEDGARWSRTVSPDSADGETVLSVTDEDRDHWAFLPLRTVVPPDPVDGFRVQTPVDLFVGHRQHVQGIKPSAPAKSGALIRRLYFDLVGLPPSRDEQARWMERMAQSPTGARDLVEYLLHSPDYGERWARHWLDVARYADSNGMELDADRPNAYRFRDFVIRSLNQDRPFDTFVRWQLAGDELAPTVPDAIAATGFLAAGVNTILPDQQMVEEKLRNRANELDDIVSTTGQALLGLTLACARCHDHKYDPLPTRDYYRLTRVFNSGDRAEVPLAAPAVVAAFESEKAAWDRDRESVVERRDAWLKAAREAVGERLRAERIGDLPIAEEEKRVLRLEPDSPAAKSLAKAHAKALGITDAELVAAMPVDQQTVWQELERALSAVKEREPKPLPKAFAFADFGAEPEETWFFERGDFLARNERMDLGFLSVLTADRSADDYWQSAKQDRSRDDSTLQRSALAAWMTDTEHGAGALLARVMVNRIWQHHFGEGLVGTVSDFGTRGELPSHPDLLEWLASEFVKSGWRVKHLHRVILESATYQQASGYDAARAELDPENRTLWRQRPVRLEAEVLRDAMLAAGGTLNRQLYGPAFKPPIQVEALQARNVRNPYPKLDAEDAEAHRRSIYLFHKRVVQYPLLQAFDAPDAQQSCGRRMNTTVAPQALAVLNDPFVRKRAADLADRVLGVADAALESRLRDAFHYALNREPEADELAAGQAFLERQLQERRDRDGVESERLAWVDFCQALFGLNEFLYID